MAYKPKYIRKKKSRKDWIFDATALLSLGLLIVGGGMFLRNRLQSKADQNAFQELAALVEVQSTFPALPSQIREEAPQAAPTEPTKPAVSPYQVLYEKNPDFAAWLAVPGTRIDYPVMHTPDDIEHYIYRAFDGSDSPSGTPFVGDYGALDQNRCVIYGHNMKDGTMFRDLELYEKKDFWQENPTFTITTLTEVREYEIFAAVRTRLLSQEESGLRYYRLEDGVEAWLKEKSLYDTGIPASNGDSIVILSTCTYHTDDGRFLIAGKLRTKDN